MSETDRLSRIEAILEQTALMQQQNTRDIKVLADDLYNLAADNGEQISANSQQIATNSQLIAANSQQIAQNNQSIAAAIARIDSFLQYFRDRNGGSQPD